MSSKDHEVREEPIPSVKDLASSEPSLRRQCLTTILDHLESRSPNHQLTPTQSLQLWRAFSVALYMHDSKSAVSVQNLIATLASTLTTFYEKDVELQQQHPSDYRQLESKDRPHNASSTDAAAADHYPWLSSWTTSFWETISREWPTIDQHRMNKYLLLIRFVLRQTFTIISSHSPSQPSSTTTSLLPSQIHILQSWPLSPCERKVPDGLRLHVLDIWLDELDQISDEAELRSQLMHPIRELAKDAMAKSVRMKAKEVVKAFDKGGG